jgi:hypothetical protein
VAILKSEDDYQHSPCPELLRPFMLPHFSWQLSYQQSCLLELSLLHPIVEVGFPNVGQSVNGQLNFFKDLDHSPILP